MGLFSSIKQALSPIFSPFREGISDIKTTAKEFNDVNQTFSLIVKANKELIKTSDTQIINAKGKYYIEMVTESGHKLVVNNKGKILKDCDDVYLKNNISNIKQLKEKVKVSDNVDIQLFSKFISIHDKYLTSKQKELIHESEEKER